MRKEIPDDEIRLNDFSNMLKSIMISISLWIYRFLKFVQRKIILITIIIILGIVIGYTLDKYSNLYPKYKEEVIIETNFKSRKLVYEYIENLKVSIKNPSIYNEIGLTKEEIGNFTSLEIEPLVQASEIIEEYHTKFDHDENLNLIIEAYNDEDLKEEKFLNFYSKHKITFKYKKDDIKSFSQRLIRYINSKDYFKKLVNLRVRQLTRELEELKSSVIFLNKYLENINQGEKKESDFLIIADESKVPSISSLLEQKQNIVEQINSLEKKIEFDKKIITQVQLSSMISISNPFYKKATFFIPIALLLLLIFTYSFIIWFKKIEKIEYGK